MSTQSALAFSIAAHFRASTVRYRSVSFYWCCIVSILPTYIGSLVQRPGTQKLQLSQTSRWGKQDERRTFETEVKLQYHYQACHCANASVLCKSCTLIGWCNDPVFLTSNRAFPFGLYFFVDHKQRPTMVCDTKSQCFSLTMTLDPR